MNIILIVSDTFRYDNLSNQAPMPVRTPELDRFKQRAVSMENCWVSSFPTIPHRTDLTSGRYSWPFHPWQSRLKSTSNHLPLILRQAGYVSQLLGDCPHLIKADFNFGFDGFHIIPGQEGDTFFLRMNHPIEEVMPPSKTRPTRHFLGRLLPDLATWTSRYWYREEDRFPPRLARLAVEWLEENYRHHPFLLWLDFFDPHEPWNPPEYMVRRYQADYSGAPMIHPNYGPASAYSPKELSNLRAHYAAEAELVDRWIGRVLQKIDDLNLWENSIVLFTSDHGISLGEHDRTGKSNFTEEDRRYWPIYPEIAHIPLLIAAPGLEGGRRIDALVQPTDILPTLLELADIETEPPETIHGRSFAPLLRGEEQPPLREFVVAAQHPRLSRQGRLDRSCCTPVVYTTEWAYAPIGPEGKPELFHLPNDPYAEHNLAPQHPQVVKELHSNLLRWLEEMNPPTDTFLLFPTP